MCTIETMSEGVLRGKIADACNRIAEHIDPLRERYPGVLLSLGLGFKADNTGVSQVFITVHLDEPTELDFTHIGEYEIRKQTRGVVEEL